VADALSRKQLLISTLRAQILGFDNIIELFLQDPEFSSIYTRSQHKPQGGYYVNQGYLFREGKLCIPHGSHRKLLVKESHIKDFEHIERKVLLAPYEARCAKVLL